MKRELREKHLQVIVDFLNYLNTVSNSYVLKGVLL